MKKKIVNLCCNDCGKLTTMPELAERRKCYFCDSYNIELGWEVSQSD